MHIYIYISSQGPLESARLPLAVYNVLVWRSDKRVLLSRVDSQHGTR